MNMLTDHRSFSYLLTAVPLVTLMLTGCGNKETGEVLAKSSPSFFIVEPVVQPTLLTTVAPTIQVPIKLTVPPTIVPSPPATPFVIGSLFDLDLDLRAGPIEVPLELQIPALEVNAPVVSVGLTAENVMSAPKGPIGDPIWHTAFWYRGSGLPGEPGTTTIAGHVNNPLGEPEIFAHLEDLQPGDLIIIHILNTQIDLRFIVDEMKVYSTQESSDPAVLKQIFGDGPVAGTKPQPSLDGRSHLTLITCAGDIVNGEFDHHTVVYATQSLR